MADTLTPNFGFIKQNRGNDWLAQMLANWDKVDTNLKDFTLGVGVTGITRTGNNATFIHKAVQNGAGFEYVSAGKSQFADLETALIEDPAAAIEIRPSGAVVDKGIKFSVASNELQMDTTQTSAFAFLKKLKIIDIQIDSVGVSKRIQGPITDGSALNLYPQFDSALSKEENLELTRDVNGIVLKGQAVGGQAKMFMQALTTFFNINGSFELDNLKMDGSTVESTAGLLVIKGVGGVNLADASFATQTILVKRFSATEMGLDIANSTTFRITPDDTGTGEHLQITRDSTNGVKLTGIGSVTGRLNLGGGTNALSGLVRITPESDNTGEFLNISRDATGDGIALEAFDGGVSDTLFIKSGLNAQGTLNIGKELVVQNELITSSGAGVPAILTDVLTVINGSGVVGTEKVTLANGTIGQIKIFIIKALGGTTDIDIAPTNFNGAATGIKLNADGEGVAMIFDGTHWNAYATNGGVFV